MLDITRDFLKEHYNIDDEMMKFSEEVMEDIKFKFD